MKGNPFVRIIIGICKIILELFGSFIICVDLEMYKEIEWIWVMNSCKPSSFSYAVLSLLISGKFFYPLRFSVTTREF